MPTLALLLLFSSASLGTGLSTSHAAGSLPSSRPAVYESAALDAVEASVDRTIAASVGEGGLAELDPSRREAFAVSRRVRARLDALERSGSCRRCWLQRKHCVCEVCGPVATSEPRAAHRSAVRRIFVYMHHKEIGLTVDTAKVTRHGHVLELEEQVVTLPLGRLSATHLSCGRAHLRNVSRSCSSRCRWARPLASGVRVCG